MRKYIFSGEEQQSSKTSRVGDSTGRWLRAQAPPSPPRAKNKKPTTFPLFLQLQPILIKSAWAPRNSML